MTVNELIKKLSELPAEQRELTVFVKEWNFYFEALEYEQANGPKQVILNREEIRRSYPVAPCSPLVTGIILA